MKTIQLIFLLLFQSTLVFSQAAKVYLEGEQNTISTEISALEKRKTELTAAKRDFITAKDLRREYYDLSLKAWETGDAVYVDKAIQKLKDAKELFEKSFAKWNAYHTENRIPKNIIDESNYTHLLLTINDLLTEEKIAAQKTGCCGPDIVEIHLVPQNVISPVNNNSEKNDFWVTGPIVSDTTLIFDLHGVKMDFSKFKIETYLYLEKLYTYTTHKGTNLISAPTINTILGFFPKNLNDETKMTLVGFLSGEWWYYDFRSIKDFNYRKELGKAADRYYSGDLDSCTWYLGKYSDSEHLLNLSESIMSQMSTSKIYLKDYYAYGKGETVNIAEYLDYAIREKTGWVGGYKVQSEDDVLSLLDFFNLRQNLSRETIAENHDKFVGLINSEFHLKDGDLYNTLRSQLPSFNENEFVQFIAWNLYASAIVYQMYLKND